MIYRLASALTLVIPLVIITPAMACRAFVKLDPTYVRHADIVVLGRVVDYKKLDEPAYSANFKIIVDEVLAGEAHGVLSAFWDNSTFGTPDTFPADQMLIALRKPYANLSDNSEPRPRHVLRMTCSDPFMFLGSSDEAKAVRKAMATRVDSDR